MPPSRDGNAKQARDEAAQALIRDYQNGDAQAFNRLLEEYRYWQYIFKGLCAKGVPPVYAEDYTQQICCRLLRTLKNFRFDCAFEYHLNIIITNQAKNYYRMCNKKIKGQRIQNLSLDELLAPPEDEKPSFDIPASNEPAPDTALLHEEMCRIIAACLRLFKSKTTKLVTCLSLKGLKQRHIMALLEIPFGTVGGHWERGKRRLRLCIQKNYHGSPTAI